MKAEEYTMFGHPQHYLLSWFTLVFNSWSVDTDACSVAGVSLLPPCVSDSILSPQAACWSRIWQTLLWGPGSLWGRWGGPGPLLAAPFWPIFTCWAAATPPPPLSTPAPPVRAACDKIMKKNKFFFQNSGFSIGFISIATFFGCLRVMKTHPYNFYKNQQK